jgi:flotillin
VIAAKRDAEQEATSITVAAEAERAAAEDRAAATRTLAMAEADAAKIRAEAQAKTYEVQAEGERKLNQARNTLAQEIIEFDLARERLRTIPSALAEAVKPLEKIGEVKIIDLGGALGTGGARNGAADGGHGTVSDNLMSALLAYRANAPMVDKLLAEAGFTGPGNLVQALVGGTMANGAMANGAAVPNGTAASGPQPILAAPAGLTSP